MFNKKQKVDYKISDLEKRVCNLENPYKFNIGDYVSTEYYSFSNNKQIVNFGTIVSQDYAYEDEHSELRRLIRFSSDYQYSPVYKRFNTYLVFHENENITTSYKESELKLHTKKK